MRLPVFVAFPLYLTRMKRLRLPFLFAFGLFAVLLIVIVVVFVVVVVVVVGLVRLPPLS